MTSLQDIRRYTGARAVKIGNYVVENQCTTREAAAHFKLSKSQVWRDCEKLRTTDYELYVKVRETLDRNISERSRRAGRATKKVMDRKKVTT